VVNALDKMSLGRYLTDNSEAVKSWVQEVEPEMQKAYFSARTHRDKDRDLER